jgi:hypothetical protein
MNRKLQFAGWAMALGISAAMVSPLLAQRLHANAPQNRPPAEQPRPPRQPQQAQRPPQSQQPRQPQRQQERPPRPPGPPQQRSAQGNANRPPQGNAERQNTGRPHGDLRANNNPNRPPNAYNPPPRNLSPQELRKNEQQFGRLPPQQKQEMRDRVEVWQRLTPEQRNHIKTEVWPRWQQLPPQRQRAIQQRLGVLKNMPESARNQHLNDPNFTRGMSEEDKATLRDLSHLHIGGAPDAPNE